MNKILYKVPLITQGIQECVQASATQILNYYEINKTIEEVKKEIPVYISPEGKPIGTSIGHIASYLLQSGFQATLHIVDVEIFDRKWQGLSSEEIVKKLQERRKYIQHSRYGEEALNIIFDGYILFLKQGGKIVFPIIDEKYLIEQLQNGPFMAIVSYNFLNDDTKYNFDKKKNMPFRDDIQGVPSTHAIVVSGYSNGKFSIVDPDYENGGKKTVNANRLVGSIYLAETDLDSLIMTVKKK